MSDLRSDILTVLSEAAPGTKVPLTASPKLALYDTEAVLHELDQLAEEGLLALHRLSGMTMVENHMVNYFYELTEAGRQKLSPGA
ncbi:hypothetical protein ABB02_00205 [Clostridiaceae bacterium JG1575]|nr:hypothetical protein ABB02_00205 [Clostridiaceae bacterium JG1575]